MAKVFSGVQPTGELTIGNYLGAMKNWVKMQEENECLFCLVDLHAITLPQDPMEIKQTVIINFASYIACGLNPEKSVIFIQSDVPEHTELAWLLSCSTPIGWLTRMTQFKDKAAKDRESSSLGLLAYPVLMAADILLYHATHVPVGDDQTQHLELTRDIAGAFNRQFKTDYFKEPIAVNNKSATRIMSLRDTGKKMSKSDESDYSRINLLDSPDLIMQKFKKAKTDSVPGIYYDEKNRPEISNLINIYCAFTENTIEEANRKFADYSNADFKQELAEITIEHLSPIQRKVSNIFEDKGYILNLAKIGSEKARNIARKTIKEVKELIGIR
jgi:tryptophanyl-tRNA synthetase